MRLTNMILVAAILMMVMGNGQALWGDISLRHAKNITLDNGYVLGAKNANAEFNTITYAIGNTVYSRWSNGTIIDSGVHNSVDARVINSALSKSGKSVLTDGFYVAETSILVPSNTWFAGAGNTTIKAKDALNFAVVRNTNQLDSQYLDHDIKISDLIIDGNGVHRTDGISMCIEFRNVDNITLVDLTTKNAYNYQIGFRNYGPRCANNIKIDRCNVIKDYSGSIFGDTIAMEATNVSMTSCHIYNTNGDGWTTGAAEDILISGCTIDSSNAPLNYESWGHIHNCTAIGNNLIGGGWGVILQVAAVTGDISDIKIIGNKIRTKNSASSVFRVWKVNEWGSITNVIINSNDIVDQGTGTGNIYAVFDMQHRANNFTITANDILVKYPSVHPIMVAVGCDDMIFSNNRCIGGTFGLNLYAAISYNATISDNEFKNMNMAGIYSNSGGGLVSSSITNNKFINVVQSPTGEWNSAINLYASVGNIIALNQIGDYKTTSTTTYGIKLLTGSTQNIVLGNQNKHYATGGIYASDSGNVLTANMNLTS